MIKNLQVGNLPKDIANSLLWALLGLSAYGVSRVRRVLDPRLRLVGCLIGILMIVGLTGCGDGNAPPQSVVAQAVALQAQQAQYELWQQLSHPPEPAPELQIWRVKVRRSRPVKVADILAYELTGTYQSKIRYVRRPPLKQSQVPFAVVLQTISDAEGTHWQLLQIGSAVDGGLDWSWLPLNA